MSKILLAFIGLIFIGFIQYGMTNPSKYKPQDSVLNQIKCEYKNECTGDGQHIYPYYSCDDLRKFINKREKTNELHK